MSSSYCNATLGRPRPCAEAARRNDRRCAKPVTERALGACAVSLNDVDIPALNAQLDTLLGEASDG